MHFCRAGYFAAGIRDVLNSTRFTIYLTMKFSFNIFKKLILRKVYFISILIGKRYCFVSNEIGPFRKSKHKYYYLFYKRMLSIKNGNYWNQTNYVCYHDEKHTYNNLSMSTVDIYVTSQKFLERFRPYDNFNFTNNSEIPNRFIVRNEFISIN